MNKPLVTIITPAYNCAQFIAETIDSVLDNGYENIEYIIIDDGSKDKSWREVTKHTVLARTLPQIHHHKTNKGEQKTVNEGLSMVKGKYFMIVNADDPLLPGAIEQLVNFMEANPNVLCAYPDWRSINEDGSFKAHINSREYDFSYMVKHHTCLPSVGSMFRSSVIETVGYRDTSFRWLGDFDFWLRIGLAGKMAYVRKRLATWRHREGQASKDKSDDRAKEHIRIMEKFYSLPDIPLDILKVRREAICWSYLVATAVTDSKLKMAYYLLKAFLTHPTILFSLEFWDTVVRRANYILRR